MISMGCNSFVVITHTMEFTKTWTEIARRQYRRAGMRYASHLSDAAETGGGQPADEFRAGDLATLASVEDLRPAIAHRPRNPPASKIELA
jgi:hypothetical protein